MPADEFPDDGGRRNDRDFLRTEGHKIAQEFEQAYGLGICRRGGADASEQRLRIELEQLQFENQR